MLCSRLRTCFLVFYFGHRGTAKPAASNFPVQSSRWWHSMALPVTACHCTSGFTLTLTSCIPGVHRCTVHLSRSPKGSKGQRSTLCSYLFHKCFQSGIGSHESAIRHRIVALSHCVRHLRCARAAGEAVG